MADVLVAVPFSVPAVAVLTVHEPVRPVAAEPLAVVKPLWVVARVEVLLRKPDGVEPQVDAPLQAWTLTELIAVVPAGLKAIE